MKKYNNKSFICWIIATLCFLAVMIINLIDAKYFLSFLNFIVVLFYSKFAIDNYKKDKND